MTEISNWALIVYAVYIPFLISIYFLELFVIARHRKQYNSSFYIIFSVMAIVDILACLIGSFLYRLPLYSMINRFYRNIPENWFLLPPVHTLGYYFNCLSQILGVLLALNRFTGLFLPQFHDKIWRVALIPSFLLSLVLSALPVWFLFGCTTEFLRTMITDPADISYSVTLYILMVYCDDSSQQVSILPQQQIWLKMVAVTVACNTISILVYIACLMRLCFFSKTRNVLIERNFFLVGFTSMLFSLPYMAALLYFHLVSIGSLSDEFDGISFVVFQLPWLTDLKYLSPAPILLLTNKSIRREIKTFFCGNQVKKIKNSTKCTQPSTNT